MIGMGQTTDKRKIVKLVSLSTVIGDDEEGRSLMCKITDRITEYVKKEVKDAIGYDYSTLMKITIEVEG